MWWCGGRGLAHSKITGRLVTVEMVEDATGGTSGDTAIFIHTGTGTGTDTDTGTDWRSVPAKLTPFLYSS
jgi:hypothetical protein